MSSYKDDLLNDLRDRPGYAAKYLAAAAADSTEALLIALHDVADAKKGMAKLAAEAGVNRENLYRMLSEQGNPRLQSLAAILKALHLRLSVEPIEADNAIAPMAHLAESLETVTPMTVEPPVISEGMPIVRIAVQPTHVGAQNEQHRFDPCQRLLAECRFLPTQTPGYRIMSAFPYAGFVADLADIDYIVPQPATPTIGEIPLQPVLQE